MAAEDAFSSGQDDNRTFLRGNGDVLQYFWGGEWVTVSWEHVGPPTAVFPESLDESLYRPDQESLDVMAGVKPSHAIDAYLQDFLRWPRIGSTHGLFHEPSVLQLQDQWPPRPI